MADEVPPSAAAGPGPAKARLLIADTSRSVRAALGNHLRERFEVREAEDGEAAWQAVLLDGNIRVLMTELGLTKVSGSKSVMASSNTQATIIIFSCMRIKDLLLNILPFLLILILI